MTTRPEVTQHPTGVRHLVIVYAVSLAIITYIDRVCISQAMPAMSRELGLGPVQIGTVFTAFGWAYALFEIPGRYRGDRYGPRSVPIRIVLWRRLFTAATAWTWKFATLVATAFLS